MARSQTKRKRKSSILMNSHHGPGKIGKDQPPRNSVAATADIVIIATYSAMKYIAKRIPLYSVW